MNDRISKLLDEMPLIPKETRLHSVQRCAARNSCASIALASLTGINRKLELSRKLNTPLYQKALTTL